MNIVKNELTIFTDGGSRGNPGDAAYGFVVYKEEKEIYKEGRYLGIQTNNYAEYMAVISAFEWAKTNFPDNIAIKLYCDSLLVKSQLSGEYRIKHPVIKILAKKAKELESHFQNVEYFHVLRENNKMADAMVNKALDERL